MAIRTEFSPGEFCWIDLMAHDLESAAEWYGGLFGWTHHVVESPPGAPPYAFFMSGENAVAGLGQVSDEMKAQGMPPCWNSYIATADCAATEAKARELGATITVPTMEVSGFGKLAFFMDPDGASCALWQDTSTAGPGMLVGEPGGLSWNELMTRDVGKVSEFYSSLVGWEYSTMQMGDIPYTMIKNNGKDAGGIFPMDGPQFEGVPSHWMVYFEVADCDATADKAQSTDGTVLIPPTEIPVGKFACLKDPQGGAFAVITATKQC